MAHRREFTLRQVYGKDSFDRFGDDLCQHVLSYLTLEDRFRCECVSKQWQRVVYKTQTDFKYTYVHKLNVETFEWILNSCENISRIGPLFVSFNNNSMFESIVKHCNHLQHIYIDFDFLSVDTIAKFFAKFAKCLQSIECYSWPNPKDTPIWKCVDSCLKLCPNLTNLPFYANSMSTDPTNDVLFRRLNSFRFYYTNEDVNGFEVFVTRYAKTMKSMKVDISDSCHDPCIDILMTGLSQMPQLIDLKMTALLANSTVNDSRLQRIGVNCGQLKSLSLNGSIDSCELMSQLIQTMNTHFKQLKRLQLNGKYPEEFVFSSESLSGCKRLTHFTLCTKSAITAEDFTRDVNKHLPRIQHIDIRGTDITDSVLNSLSKLKKIQYIYFYGCHVNATQKAIHNLIANCPKMIRFFANKQYL